MTDPVASERLPAPEDAAATLVLLHGRGAGPGSMLALAESLGLADVACVTPAAPGRSWYPDRFFAPRAANEPHAGAALAAVHAVVDDLTARKVPADRIVLGGFSQGACLAADVLAGRPMRLGGLAVLCGGLIGAGDDEWFRPPPGSLDGVPVLITGTEQDSWVPVDRVRATAEVLRSAGAAVDLRVFPPGPHAVHPEEVDALRALVRDAAARSATPPPGAR